LMKLSIQFPAILFNNITNQLTIQNPKGIDFSNIINQLDLQYMKDLSITYQERKKSFTKLFKLYKNHEEQVKNLLIHSYDTRIAERKKDRSI
ncbi:4708_t:CDS:1, partial [Funneliformis geosporum]